MWQKDEFFEFRPGMKLEDVPKDKVLLIQMEHLRQMDLMIARGASYERTAYTFLAQVALSDQLRAIKGMSDMVVLLNEEGFITRYGGEWNMVFTPDKLEQFTLAPDAELYPVFRDIMDAAKHGEKRWVQLDDVPIRELIQNKHHFDILDKYCRDYPGGYVAVAKKVVIEGPEMLYQHVPVCSYGALKTVDLYERESYDSIIRLLSDYIEATDKAAGNPVRPLSLAVFGAPGSGKSFGVKQLAKSLGRFNISTLNLSQYNDIEELLHSLHNTLKSAKDIPLVFFDEFDSDYDGKSLGWLKFLLAPMQDGEYSFDGMTQTIEKAVFVFAGGTASSFDNFLPESEEGKAAFKLVKGPDFVSRLRGILNIKGPNPTSSTDKSYIIRRALLLRDMISRKMPNIYNKETGIINISPGLLAALLRTSEYRHGTRSMEFILDMSHVSGVDRFTPACLPMQNQVDIHLDYKDLFKKLSVERFNDEDVEKLIQRLYEINCELRIESAIKSNVAPAIIQSMRDDQVSWDWLSESHKSMLHDYFYMMAEEMEDWKFPVGIRPATEGSTDTINDLYGDILEKMTYIDHKVQVQIYTEEGWKYGPVEDSSLKLKPELCPYEELNYMQKDMMQIKMRKMPAVLREIGLELYKKAF